MVNMKIIEFHRQNNVDQIGLLLDFFEFEIRNAYPPQISAKISFLQQGVFFPVLWDDFHPTKKNLDIAASKPSKNATDFFPKKNNAVKAEVRLLPCANTPQADLQLSCQGLSLRFLFGQPSCWSSEFGKGSNSDLISRSVKRSKLKTVEFISRL